MSLKVLSVFGRAYLKYPFKLPQTFHLKNLIKIGPVPTISEAESSKISNIKSSLTSHKECQTYNVYISLPLYYNEPSTPSCLHPSEYNHSPTWTNYFRAGLNNSNWKMLVKTDGACIPVCKHLKNFNKPKSQAKSHESEPPSPSCSSSLLKPVMSTYCSTSESQSSP